MFGISIFGGFFYFELNEQDTKTINYKALAFMRTKEKLLSSNYQNRQVRFIIEEG